MKAPILPTQILSTMPLADWRGSCTTFDGFTGTRPVVALENVQWDDITKVMTPETPAILVEKSQAQNVVPCPSVRLSLSNFRVAALSWFQFGFNVIPIEPKGKSPVVKWDPWLTNLSSEKITRYWLQYPDHEVGCVVGDGLIVFDADSPESLAALLAIEKSFSITPNLVVKTKRGEHHYVRRAQGTYAACDSHSTEDYPDRLDIKTGRAVVILPPSTGKELPASMQDAMAKNALEITEIGQEFIDAVARHNGRPLPRPPAPSERSRSVRPKNAVHVLRAILQHLDPDMGYNDWSRVGMALCYETGKSEEGFALFDRWSRAGDKYDGVKKTQAVWRSFKTDLETPVRIGTLYWMARNAGVSKQAISAEVEAFQKIGGQNGTV